MVNILITGGTGFLGTHLVKKLNSLGYNLKLLIRKNSNISTFQDLKNIEYSIGEVNSIEFGTRFPTVKGKPLNISNWMSFTYPFNLTGLPAASIPCGWTDSGLPIGMQIIGKRYDEKTVLQVSKAFEEIAPWQSKRPEIK